MQAQSMILIRMLRTTKYLWILLTLINVLVIYWLIVPYGDFRIVGTSFLTKIYLYLSSFLLSSLFFLLNSCIINKQLKNPYFNVIYLISNLLVLVLTLQYIKLNKLSLNNFILINLSSYFVSIVLFYITYSITKKIVQIWNKNYFIVLLPLVWVDYHLKQSFWIVLAVLFVYFMLYLTSETNNKKS